MSIYRKVTTDDFHTIGELNTKRIKAYNEIAKDYNIDLGTVRDIFSLGINFAVANIEKNRTTNKRRYSISNK